MRFAPPGYIPGNLSAISLYHQETDYLSVYWRQQSDLCANKCHIIAK